MLRKLLRKYRCLLRQVINFRRRKHVYLLNVTRALNVLYGGTYDANIARIIVSASTVNMLKNMFELLNMDDIDVANYRRSCDYYEDGAFQVERRVEY